MYVVWDGKEKGWAEVNPIEGLVLTRLLEQATRFPNAQQAAAIIDRLGEPGRFYLVHVGADK